MRSRSNVLLRVMIALLPAFLWTAATVQTANAGSPEIACRNIFCSSADAMQQNNALYLPTIAAVGQPTPRHAVIEPLPSWSGEWWQWNERTQSGPVLQEGDVDCSIGQGGTRWFLAGTLSGIPVTRNCSIPSANTLLAPLFIGVYYNDPSENLTVEEKRDFIDSLYSSTEPGPFNSQICHLAATIDGTPITPVRLQSAPFAFQGDFEAVSDGFWIAFQLLPGRHQVYFHGSLCEYHTENELNTDLFKPVDVTYNLTATE